VRACLPVLAAFVLGASLPAVTDIYGWLVALRHACTQLLP
jgi:hypothetical protein